MTLIRYSGNYSVRNTAVFQSGTAPSDLNISFTSPGETTSISRDDELGEWVAYRLKAEFDFDAVGILKLLIDPLAAAAVPIMAFSSYLTDHVLVKSGDASRAEDAWQKSGIGIEEA